MTAPLPSCEGHLQHSYECGPCREARRPGWARIEAGRVVIGGPVQVGPDATGTAVPTRITETRYADDENVMRLASEIADRNSEIMRRLERSGHRQSCGPCRDRSAAVVAEQIDRVGRADANGNIRVHPQVDSVASRKVEPERLRATACMEAAQDVVEVLDPEGVGSVRGEVVNDAAVVDLNSHGRKRIARRVLTAAAVAAVALWAVAS